MRLPALALLLLAALGCAAGARSTPSPSAATPAALDVVIRGGTVYDGSGRAPVAADVGIVGDSIVAVGDLAGRAARRTIDARGLAVAPGFINMLSWAGVPLLIDGRSQSDIRQGVTLEVMGEGWSMGPWSDSMKARTLAEQGDLKYDIHWTTLGEFLDYLTHKGVAPNVASFVGATTVRIHEVGYANRPATPAELARMQDLVRQAMREGAMGVGSSLIYAPANYAPTEELIALSKAAGESGGMYISHMRDESGGVIAAVDELIRIAREAGVPAEIYHLKASGRANWGKLDSIIARVEAARAAGLRITADMYNYPASSTGLDAALPTWVQEGGTDAFLARLRDSATRARVLREMRGETRGPGGAYDNAFANAGGPQGVLLVGFKNPADKPLTGKTLAEVAALRGKPAEETALDLLLANQGDVGCVYFTMSEDNVRREVALPWMSFASDAGSQAPEGPFLLSSTHPRAYGNFARLLGKYVREERVIPLEEAVRRLTSLPASNLKLRRRGTLAPGYYADVVVFDPATIADRATFQRPQQYAVGMRDVFVNGVQVLRDGEHTGATPGRVVRGPGWSGWSGGAR